MKPNSIVQFERLYLASVVVWLAGSALSFDRTLRDIEATAPGSGLGAGVLIAFLLATCGVAAGIWYLIAKRRSVLGKWLLSIWFLISTCIVSAGLMGAGWTFNLVLALSWIAFGLGVWALSYLFKPDADAWFGNASD